jgi:hypothetical protein
MDAKTLSAYDGNAAKLAARYASADVSSFAKKARTASPG